MASDYYFAGMIAGISLLQNGQIPRYFSEELINQIFVSDEPCTSLCILEFRRGLDRLGIHAFTQVCQYFPTCPQQDYREKFYPITTTPIF